MQWVFLIGGDDSFTLNHFSEMHFRDSQKIILNKEQLEIQYDNNDYAIFYREENADDIKSNFSPSEFEEYLQKLPFDVPRWIMLKYSNVSILKKIVSEKGFPTDVIIDCDGVDLGLEEVFDKRKILETASPKF